MKPAHPDYFNEDDVEDGLQTKTEPHRSYDADSYKRIEMGGDGGHVHVDKHGFVHRCYHACRNNLLSASFWLGVTLSYPLEHFLWEHVYPFNVIAHHFGLLH